MIRVARLREADNTITFAVDHKHKLGGRGCHICHSCIEKCVKTKALNRSFKGQVPEDIYKDITK